MPDKSVNIRTQKLLIKCWWIWPQGNFLTSIFYSFIPSSKCFWEKKALFNILLQYLTFLTVIGNSKRVRGGEGILNIFINPIHQDSHQLSFLALLLWSSPINHQTTFFSKENVITFKNRYFWNCDEICFDTLSDPSKLCWVGKT